MPPWARKPPVGYCGRIGVQGGGRLRGVWRWCRRYRRSDRRPCRSRRGWMSWRRRPANRRSRGEARSYSSGDLGAAKVMIPGVLAAASWLNSCIGLRDAVKLPPQSSIQGQVRVHFIIVVAINGVGGLISRVGLAAGIPLGKVVRRNIVQKIAHDSCIRNRRVTRWIKVLAAIRSRASMPNFRFMTAFGPAQILDQLISVLDSGLRRVRVRSELQVQIVEHAGSGTDRVRGISGCSESERSG